MDEGFDQLLAFFGLGEIDRQRQFGLVRMSLGDILQHDNDVTRRQLLAPSGLERFPRVADTVDLAAIERQPHVGRAFVTGD